MATDHGARRRGKPNPNAIAAMRAAHEQAEVDSGGRPPKYRRGMVTQLKKLCRLAATDIEIADFFGVTVETLYAWKHTHKEFSEGFVVGKEMADARVERSLFMKAAGYTFESEKVFQYQGDIIRAKTREHVPPSEGAAMMWLKNRQKDKWRDTQDFESGGEKLANVVFTNALPRPDTNPAEA